MGQDGRAPEKPLPLNLEIYGGFAAIHPADLNLLAGYYNAYPIFFYTQQYEYLHAGYRDLFTYSAGRSGGDRLKTIQQRIPFRCPAKVRPFPCSLRFVGIGIS